MKCFARLKILLSVLFLILLLIAVPVSAATNFPAKIKLSSNFDFESDVANSFFVNGNQNLQQEFEGTVTRDGNKFDVNFDPINYQYGYISGWAKGTIEGDQIYWTFHSTLVDHEFPHLVEVVWEGTGTGKLIDNKMYGQFHFEKYHSQSDPLGNPHSASIIGDSSVEIELKPVADFKATPTSGSAPLKVTFTDKSQGYGITTRVWQFKLKSDSEWTTFTLDKKSSHNFINDGIYDIKLNVTGTGGSDEELKSELLKIGCDFSKQPDIEKCFGGIGVNCEGTPVTWFKQNDKTCEVKGWMSIGSILHDQCCLSSGNTGVGCANPDGSDKCQKAWDEAWANTRCSLIGSPRQWKVTFGPYPVGNTGDFGDVPKADLRAPSGTRVKPEYQELCTSGKCKVNKKGITQHASDDCGIYCICQ